MSPTLAFTASEGPTACSRTVLKHLCREDRRIIEPGTERAAKLPYLSLEHIESGTGRILKKLEGQPEDDGKSTTFWFDSRHVLYGKLRPYLNKVATPEFEGRCTTEMIPLLPSNDVDRGYLAWLLRSGRALSVAVEGTTGSRMPRADLKRLFALEIPLPPLPEQQRLAAMLEEQMAAVARARQAAEARLIAIEALPEAWIRHSLDRAAPTRLSRALDEVKTGVGPTWAKYSVLGATRAGLALAKDPVGKAPERYKLVDPVTVFYNPMRIQLGSIAMVDHGDPAGITSPDYVVLKGKPGVLDTRWFYFYFRSRYGESLIDALSRGAVRERILFRRLVQGEIDLPPYEVQIEDSERMRAIQPMLRQAEKQLEAIDALPAALLRRVFGSEV